MSLKMRALTARYIFDGLNLTSGKAILVDDLRIVGVVDKAKVYDSSQVEDFGDCIISPGFIDLQLNGCGGVLFNSDLSIETLEVMHQTNLRSGTTAYLPTLITDDFHNVISALEVVKEWFKLYGNSRGVIGIHLEGPFLSHEKSGIHPKEFIISPTNQMLSQIVAYTKLFPIKMTIAPENFSPDQIEFLVRNRVVVAIGHSNASYDQAQAAFDSGAITVTHMFNAMSGLTGRNPGVIGAALANPCYAGLIVDLLHVDKANVKLMAKLKPTGTYLVTDAVTPTGTDLSEFEFAGKKLYVRDGKCVDAHGTLGGAYLTMNQAVQNCVKKCDISLEQALMMATLIPAQVIGLQDELGRIAEGYRADLITINYDNFDCKPVL